MPDMTVPTLARATVTYTIPEAFRQFETDPKAVTMRPLSVREEIQAAKAARLTEVPDTALPYELLRASVVKLNGEQIDWSTSAPQWVEACSPKCREMLMKAFLRLNRNGEGDKAAEASFFDSAVLSSS